MNIIRLILTVYFGNRKKRMKKLIDSIVIIYQSYPFHLTSLIRYKNVRRQLNFNTLILH